jgi:hypothetical protein
MPWALFTIVLASVGSLGAVVAVRRARSNKGVSVNVHAHRSAPILTPTTRVEAMPQIVVRLRQPGSKNENTFDISESPFSIGSSPNCDLVLGATDDVVAHHARVWLRDGKVMIHHVADSGQTTVNGKPTYWASLEDGDQIAFGSQTFDYNLVGRTSND